MERLRRSRSPPRHPHAPYARQQSPPLRTGGHQRYFQDRRRNSPRHDSDYHDFERRFQPADRSQSGRRNDNDGFWQCFDPVEVRRIGFEIDRRVDQKLQRYISNGDLPLRAPQLADQPAARPVAFQRNFVPPPPPAPPQGFDFTKIVNDFASKLASTQYNESLLRKDNVHVHEELAAANRKLDKYKAKKKAKKLLPPPIPIDQTSDDTRNPDSDANPIPDLEPIPGPLPNAPRFASPRYANALNSPAKTPTNKRAATTPRRQAAAAVAAAAARLPPGTASSTSTDWEADDLPGRLLAVLRGLKTATKKAITGALRDVYPGSTTLEDVWAVAMPAGSQYPQRDRQAALTALSNAIHANFAAIQAA